MSRVITSAVATIVGPLVAITVAASLSAGASQEAATSSPECSSFEALTIPQADLPNASERRGFARCNSVDLYYGIGRPVDDAGARKCALVERDTNGSKPLSGPQVLTMIYANGRGVPRNLDLAIKFACEAGGAPSEVTGRRLHLEQMRRAPDVTRSAFDFCDDVTSGYMMGFCSGVSERIAAAKRTTRLNSLLVSWPPAHVSAFNAFRRVADEFFATRSDLEVDQSGTARAAFVIEELASLNDELVDSLSAFELGELPALAAADRASSESALASALTRIRTTPPGFGTVTTEGILKTQQAWVAYRAAWLRFAHVRYPRVSDDSWIAWLTRARIKMLKDFVTSSPLSDTRCCPRRPLHIRDSSSSP
jgi:hypothetical protein